jgi:RNA 3'-phosphate cyclase
VTNKAVKVLNIRGARCSAGLRPQHLMGVKIAGEFCDAEIKGLEIGSTEVEFIPKSFNFIDREIDIGTAGSIPLLLQTLTPILISTDKKIVLEIAGGTDVHWSPNMFYFQHVFCDFLKKMGSEIDVEILKHGFYPRGGGKVRVAFSPIEKLKPLNLVERGKFLGVDAWSVASENLKKARVAERQIEGLEEKLERSLENKNIVYANSLSPGSSLHTNAHYENCKIGAGSLGKRGKPAERVGEEAAEELKKSIESKATLDKYMADQILPFFALAGEGKVIVEKITEHCLTNIFVIEKFLPVKFEVEKENREISVKGTGK